MAAKWHVAGRPVGGLARRAARPSAARRAVATDRPRGALSSRLTGVTFAAPARRSAGAGAGASLKETHFASLFRRRPPTPALPGTLPRACECAGACAVSCGHVVARGLGGSLPWGAARRQQPECRRAGRGRQGLHRSAQGGQRPRCASASASACASAGAGVSASASAGVGAGAGAGACPGAPARAPAGCRCAGPSPCARGAQGCAGGAWLRAVRQDTDFEQVRCGARWGGIGAGAEGGRQAGPSSTPLVGGARVFTSLAGWLLRHHAAPRGCSAPSAMPTLCPCHLTRCLSVR